MIGQDPRHYDTREAIIISERTLNTEHLIEAFEAALEERDEDTLHTIKGERDFREYYRRPGSPDERAALYLEDLREALECNEPEGYYFGSHEGDGACIGYFPIEGWLPEEIEPDWDAVRKERMEDELVR